MSRIGSNAAAGATVSVPAHGNGDLLVLFAMNAVSATAPSTPAGWTSVNGSAATVGTRTAFLVSDGTVTTVTSTNATGVIVVVYTSVDATPIGGSSSWSTWSGRTTLQIPSVTLVDSDGSSTWLSASIVQGTGFTFTSVAGQSEIVAIESAGITYVAFDRASVTTIPGDATTVAPSGTYNNRSFSIEVRLAPSGGGNKFRPYFITG